MEREVRYCTTEDGVRIAYCVEGEGSPLLVLPIFFESFSLDHLCPEYKQFVERLGDGRQIVRIDGRGSGMSDAPRDIDYSYEGLSRDLEAVIDALGGPAVSIWAGTTSGITALLYAARRPEKIARLILYGTYASVPAVFPEPVVKSFEGLAASNFPLACQIYADMTGRREFPEEAAHLGDWYLQSAAPEVVALRIGANIHFDASALLSGIKIPVLVLHRIADPTFPIAEAQRLGSTLPNARFIPLQGKSHLAAFGENNPVIQAVHEFLDQDPLTRRRTAEPAAEEAQGAFRTILFTDLVGHTAMMRRLGDEKGRAVLREHETITRNILKQHGGAEVKTMGDGFMASFPSVTRAVECAIALQTAFTDRNETAGEPLAVRVGLNAGEPIEEDGDLFGETIILAARIAAMAQGGEILASMAVRELCAGKGFLFADMGEHAMRGFEDPVRVFEIKRPA